MKVFQIIPSFSLGGAEIMCENLIYELRNKGVEVIAVSLYDLKTPITKRLTKKGVEIRYLQKKKGMDLSLIGKLYQLIKKEKPDVIHAHLYSMKYAILGAICSKVKCRIHTVHNMAIYESDKWNRKANRFFYRFLRVVPVALSEEVRDSICEEYKINKNCIPIVFNGINLENCIEKENYKNNEVFRVLHVGRFMEQKNHVGLIEAFSIFHKKFQNSVLELIGEGEKKQEIERLVNEKGLLNCIYFLGAQDNVYQYLNRADVFVLPSLYEGVPMTLIEAMGTGLPIIATNVGGIPNMLQNGKNALLVENDIEQIVESLVFFANSEKNRKGFGQNAKIEAKRFSVKIMAENYLEIYKEKIR